MVSLEGSYMVWKLLFSFVFGLKIILTVSAFQQWVYTVKIWCLKLLAKKTSVFTKGVGLVKVFLCWNSVPWGVNAKPSTQFNQVDCWCRQMDEPQSWILSEMPVTELAVVYLSAAQLLRRVQAGQVVLCVLSLCATCVDAGRLCLAYIVRHFWLSMAPCFLLWGLPQLREALSLTVQAEHYVSVSGCFGPLHEWGNHRAGRLRGFTGLMRQCDEVPSFFYVFNWLYWPK